MFNQVKIFFIIKHVQYSLKCNEIVSIISTYCALSNEKMQLFAKWCNSFVNLIFELDIPILWAYE